MRILVRSSIRSHRIKEETLRRFVRCVLRQCGCPETSELGILFVGADAMRRINRTYFGRNSDTDVIAFPYGDDESEAGGGVLLGDIVVSVHRARVQAREWHTDINREILLYIVHGILHLCGYDDTRPRERKRMEARQDYILKRAFKIRQWNVINL